ncbi:MAG: CoA transferase [Gammaproteobacteria bacterium]|nr:CoA transferase [Gammaproteobacteria bacterium]
MTHNPRLVHATLTGYGTTGPEAARPGYDVTAFFGRSGLYDAMREGEDGEVPMARPAQGDHTAGLALVAAILGGLRLGERTAARARWWRPRSTRPRSGHRRPTMR